ncbi:hypothetical protein ACSBR2_032473 [Camellia fascicularis]
MANDGQKKKVGDNFPTGSGKHIDPNAEEDNCNEETQDQNHGDKDVGQQGDVPKKSNRNGYYNEDNLQPPFLLQDTPILAAKNNAQKRGQKVVLVAPQHDRIKRHSHWPSREVGHEESTRRESQKTRRTKEACTKEHRDVQAKELCFDTTNGERSKRTHNDIGSSAPKRLKSGDSQALRQTKKDLRDYLQRKQQNTEITSPVKPRTPFSVEFDKFEALKRFSMP